MPKPSTDSPLRDIIAFTKRFVAFTDESHAVILALWILHTWTFDAAYATPYIYVNSAEPQSGKTRMLEIAHLLARNSQRSDIASSASLYRMLADMQPTLFVDEVDTVFTGAKNEDLRGVLNSGYKSGSLIPRFTGKEVEWFPTFCPKMLVGIDNAEMPDTLRDRCIPMVLKRKKAGQEVERFIPRKVEPEAEELRERIETWANRNMERILRAPDPAIIEGISDRKFEISEPLLTVAAVCGFAREARKALRELLAGQMPKKSPGIQALESAHELMTADVKLDRISSASLAAHLGISPKKLGVILNPYGITPSTVRFASGEKAKGYHRSDFQDAWERYL